MTAERKEFDKFRRDFKKEHGWPGLICARCGHFVRGGRFGVGGHMHHLSPLRKGGPNTADNLIPLCHVCHNDVEELVQLGDIERVLMGRMMFCTPHIGVDGSIKLGESDLCPVCASIYDDMETIMAKIRGFKCHGCDHVNSRLPELYRRLL